MLSCSRDILIVGAGVLGLSTAATLRARGHAVTVVDPDRGNASSVAAGMIAPAMESAIETVAPEHAALLRAAAGLWPKFAAAHGVDVAPAMTEWRGDGADDIYARLLALGFSAERTDQAVRAEGDLRLDPASALARLAYGVGRIDGWAQAVASHEGGWAVELADGRVLTCGVLVLATGPETLGAAPETVRQVQSRVFPVRGQIGFIAESLTGHTVRGAAVYVTPIDGGAVIGATMEPRRRDLAPDEATSHRLRRAAEELLARPIDPEAIDWRVGVRGASADGLPLAGQVAPGLAVALAPRRNGWLFGPLVAEVVADAIEGRTPRAEAAALNPSRISPAG